MEEIIASCILGISIIVASIILGKSITKNMAKEKVVVKKPTTQKVHGKVIVKKFKKFI